MLLAKNLKQKKLSKKLSNKLIESFHIFQSINKQMYHYKVYFIFHVFLLKSYKCKLNDNFILNYFASELIDDK